MFLQDCCKGWRGQAAVFFCSQNPHREKRILTSISQSFC